MFSSPKILFVDKIFLQQIILFSFYFFIMAWVDDSISSPTVSSPKDLYGDEIFCHQLFLFSFIFIFINYGVTLVFRHLKIYVVTKYCVTNYFLFFYYFFLLLLSYGVTILLSLEILCHLRLYGVTKSFVTDCFRHLNIYLLTQ